MRFGLLLVPLLCVSLFRGWAIDTTNEGYQLLTNSRKIIMAHNTCRVFVNTSTSKAFFIPTKTSAEFTSFINNKPTEVTVDTCRSCSDLHIGSGGTLASGVYDIDPDGPSTGLGAVKFYCDMTNYGGGWTLVWSNTRGGTNKPVTSLTYTLATTGGPRCSTANSSTSDFTGACSMISSNKEGFNYFIGLNHWNNLGRTKKYMEFRYQWSHDYGQATQQEVTAALQKFDSALNYTLYLTNLVTRIGARQPGIYTYHSGRPLSTYDADNDAYGASCSALYSNTPFWYTACWSGNISGGGENLGQSYYNGAYWDSSSQSWGSTGGDGAGNGWYYVREYAEYSSCAELKTIGGFINSGTYTIDADGPGGAAPTSTYCTM